MNSVSNTFSFRIFIQFDEDESNSLEIEELVTMLMQNYVSPLVADSELRRESAELRAFVG
jgi:hypothetical protein